MSFILKINNKKYIWRIYQKQTNKQQINKTYAICYNWGSQGETQFFAIVPIYMAYIF